MRLKDYLSINDIRLKKLGEDLNLSPSYISRLINGHLKPSHTLAHLISYYTKGQVSPTDWGFENAN